MKSVSLLCAASVIALVFSACCTTAPKKTEQKCVGGSCKAPTSGHSQVKKDS
jgi:hypothetical protein